MRLGGDIAARLLELAVVAIGVATRLPTNPAGLNRHVAGQLVRAATGGGANYEEARAAESRDDFIHKVGLAAKEMRETTYWLGLIERAGWLKGDLRAAVCEASQLAAILGASARTARARVAENRRRS